MDAPVRPCCFKRHFGAQCPDGLVMCCLCFKRFVISGLSAEDGQPIDVCLGCAADELAALEAQHDRG